MTSSMQIVHCPICGLHNHFKIRYPEAFDKSLLNFTARQTPDHMHFRIVQCTGCGLIYSNPILPEQEMIELYRLGRFIEEPQLENMIQDYLDQVEQIIDSVRKENLLEIGCANGFFLREMRKYGFKELYGIEPSRSSVEKAHPDIHPRIYNAVLKPNMFPEEYFDLICFFQVFDHILEPNEFLQTIFRYLRPGGMILAIHHDIKALMPTLLGVKASTYDISHVYLWDKDTMKKILEKNSFKVISIKNINSRYQLDHVIRMLPLPSWGKNPLRALLRCLHLSRVTIKAKVENMVCVARKENQR